MEALSTIRRVMAVVWAPLNNAPSYKNEAYALPKRRILYGVCE